MSNLNKENPLEKIYTPRHIIEYLDECLKEFYKEPPTEFLEPAAGDGQIINYLKEVYPHIPCLAYDIFNETGREDIIETDFLKTPLEYKRGRVTIMNPPFTKGTKFIYKCLEVSDYVIAITSASTFVSLDWDKIEADCIRVSKKTKFINFEKGTDIAILCLKKK